MVNVKLLASIFAFALAATLFTGYKTIQLQPSNGKEEKVQIMFWDDNEDPDRKALWEELIGRFESENPSIDVVYMALHKDSAKSKLDAAVASRDTPDVASVYTSWLPEFAEKNALLPLDTYFESWSKKEKINEDSIRFNRTIVKDNLLYGVPYTQNLDVLWIRSDWLEEAGVEIPETWEGFFNTAQLLTDKPSNQFGYSIRGGAGSSFQLQRLMYAYSGIGTYFQDGKSTLNHPKHIKFLEKYFSLYQQYTPKSDIANDYYMLVAGFDAGIVGMIQHNLGSYGEHKQSLEKEQFEAVPLPKSTSGRHVVEGGNTIGLSIFKDTKHPDEAWEFVQYINSKDAQSFWNKEVGQIPTNSDAMREDWVKGAAHIQRAIEIYEDPATVVYEPAFYLPEYRSILNMVVDSGIQAVLSGQKTVEEFLNEWAHAVEEANKQYKTHALNKGLKPD